MKTLYALLTVMGLLLTSSAITAADYGCGCQTGAACGHHCPACPKCNNKICTSQVERIKEKRSCFEVECKEICVPAITLPCWTDAIPFLKKKDKCCESGCDSGCCKNMTCPDKECCPAPRCGYVKTVKVLKKREYECDSCGYKWNIEAPCCDSGACSNGACVDGSCNAGGAPCDQGYTVPPAAEQHPVELPPVPPQANGGAASSFYHSTGLRFSK